MTVPLALVVEMLRVRFAAEIGVVVAARVLPSQAGRVLVIVDFADECPSSLYPGRREVGVACVRRLAGRAWGPS